MDPSSWTQARGPELVDPMLGALASIRKPGAQIGLELVEADLLACFFWRISKLFRVCLPWCNLHIYIYIIFCFFLPPWGWTQLINVLSTYIYIYMYIYVYIFVSSDYWILYSMSYFHIIGAFLEYLSEACLKAPTMCP